MPTAVRLIMGQGAAFLMSCTGVASTLLVNSGASFPLLQAVVAYAAIAAFFLPAYLMMVRNGLIEPIWRLAERAADRAVLLMSDSERSGVIATNALSSTDASRVSLVASRGGGVAEPSSTGSIGRAEFSPSPISPLQGSSRDQSWRWRLEFAKALLLHLWPYALIAVVDLEANYVVVLSYRYTDMTSVQLLDCFTVPCVMVLSFLVLRVRVTVIQLVGAGVAIAGLCTLVAFDVDGLSRTSARPNPFLGDILCLVSSALYALSNVACETLLKRREMIGAAPGPMAPATGETPMATGSCTTSANDTAGGASSVEINQRPSTSPTDRVSPPMPPTLSTSSSSGVDTSAVPSVGVFFSGVGVSELESGPMSTPAVSWQRHLTLSYGPVVTYLALMPLFGLVFGVAQFRAVEWRDFDEYRGQWSSSQTGYMALFGLSMIVAYGVMPLLFVIASATFANLSLLTSDAYSVVWNASLFGVRPRPLFFIPFSVTLAGVVVYDTNGFDECRRRRAEIADSN